MDKIRLVHLIEEYITTSEQEYGMSSYALKGLFEHLTNNYISVRQFEQAMILAGFTPLNHPDTNHHYCIMVKQSPSIPMEYWGHGYTLI